MSDQLALDFGGRQADGVTAWRAERERAMAELARANGVPLGKRVRVDFWNGPSLEGRLLLDEETLFVARRADAHLCLRVGTASFHKDEIAAFVTLEEDTTG